MQNSVITEEIGDWINIWSGLSTVATLALFIGVIIWAMSKKRNKDFDEASKIPLD